MEVEILQDLETTPVPRDTKAPWLKKSSHKVMLTQDFVLKLDGVRYIVPRGYVTDGSTVPRFLWWLYPPHYTEARRGSAFHDYCYSHLYKKVGKKFADKALKAIMRHCGSRSATASIFYRATRWFGKGGW